MILARQIGVEALSSFFRRGIRSFQDYQILYMRKAAGVVRDRVTRNAERAIGLAPVRRRIRKDSKGRVLGPLVKRIKARVRRSQTDVYAVIGPSRLAFYGRFLETGINKRVTRGMPGSRGRRKQHTKPYQLRIRATPYIAPAIPATEREVIEILGESYRAFTDDRPVQSFLGSILARRR